MNSRAGPPLILSPAIAELMMLRLYLSDQATLAPPASSNGLGSDHATALS